MNTQIRFTQDELNLMLQEPFAVNRRIPGIIQEEIGKRWALSVPRHFRPEAANTGKPKRRKGCTIDPSANGSLGGAVRAEQAAKERNRLARELRPLLESGVPLYRAAMILGIGWTRAKKVAVENGFEQPAQYHGRGKQISRFDTGILAERAKLVQQMIDRGDSKNQICVALQISRAALKRVIKRIEAKAGFAAHKVDYAERNGQIIDLYRQGYTHEDIAARFSLKKNTVQKIVRGAA